MSRAGSSDAYRAKSRKVGDIFSLRNLFSLTKVGENWDEKIAQAKIKNNWAEIMGVLSENIQLVEIVDGIAKIQTTNPTFATQLKLYENTVLEKINAYRPESCIENIAHTIQVINPVAVNKPVRRGYYRRKCS